MDTRTIGEQKILTPDLDPRDLDPVAEEPDDDLVEALVDGVSWTGNRLGGERGMYISPCLDVVGR